MPYTHLAMRGRDQIEYSLDEHNEFRRIVAPGEKRRERRALAIEAGDTMWQWVLFERKEFADAKFAAASKPVELIDTN